MKGSKIFQTVNESINGSLISYFNKEYIFLFEHADKLPH